MGFFGPSKREREEAAQRLDKEAHEHAAMARQHRATAAEVRERDRHGRDRDSKATRAIAEFEEINARIFEDNARDLRAVAEQARKP